MAIGLSFFRLDLEGKHEKTVQENMQVQRKTSKTRGKRYRNGKHCKDEFISCFCGVSLPCTLVKLLADTSNGFIGPIEGKIVLFWPPSGSIEANGAELQYQKQPGVVLLHFREGDPPDIRKKADMFFLY